MLEHRPIPGGPRCGPIKLLHSTAPWNPPSPAHGSPRNRDQRCFAAPVPWSSRTTGDLTVPRTPKAMD